MKRRAHKICSSWEQLHLEILNIKQLLVSNGFSNKNIEEEINNFLSNQNQEYKYIYIYQNIVIKKMHAMWVANSRFPTQRSLIENLTLYLFF